MTVSTTASTVTLAGNGVATVFPYPFRVMTSGDMKVDLISPTGSVTRLSAGYTVSGVGSTSGGSVTYPTVGSPLAAGYAIRLSRELAVTQESRIGNQGSFLPQVHEDALDRLTMICQQFPSRSELDALKGDTLGSLVANEFIGTGAQTVFTITTTIAGGSKSLLVSVDGVQQPTSSYSVAGTTLTFSEAPPYGALIDVRVIGAAVSVSLADGSEVTATGGTGSASLATRFGRTLNVKDDFGAAGNGISDDTAALQAAINSGHPIHLPAGTYLVTGLALLTGTSLIGAGVTRTTIKLKNAANANVITGNNTSDTYLADFKVDGNKSNQTDGMSIRGVYYSGTGQRQTAYRLLVDNCKDHGYMHSSPAGSYAQIVECRFTNCGSAAHSSAGGPGGTGCAAGGTGVRIVRCDASGNYLNGFKCGGAYHENCISQSNGSGYETGFLSGSKTYHTTYFNCHSWNNASGMNHQGQGDSISILGGSVEGNTSNGLRFVGDVNRARIIGVRFKNNGSDLVRTGDSLGPDAIGLYSNTSAPDDIIIDECEFVIDDGISTADRYAIYIENSAGVVQIGRRNSSTGYAQAVYCADTSKGPSVQGFPGFSGHYTAPAAVTLTGIATADLASVTVKARELVNRRLRLTAHGTVTGTAGTKLVRLTFGGSSVIPINQTAAEQQRWSLEVDITVTSVPDIRAVITAIEDGGTSALYTLRAAPGTVDVTFAINATANGAADVITLTDFRLRTLE